MAPAVGAFENPAQPLRGASAFHPSSLPCQELRPAASAWRAQGLRCPGGLTTGVRWPARARLGLHTGCLCRGQEPSEASKWHCQWASGHWFRPCFLLGAQACGWFEIKALFEVVRHRHEFLGYFPGQSLRTTRLAYAERWPLCPTLLMPGRASCGATSPLSSWLIKGYLGGRSGERTVARLLLLWGEECSKKRAV